MFKFLIGAFTGLVISLVFLCITKKVNAQLDLSVLTNIIIAIAAVVAAAVHYDFHKKQRLDRVWGINKGVLLDLIYVLSEVIEATEIEIQSHFGSHYERTEVKPFIWRSLDQKIDYMLNVYSPLLSLDLLTAKKLIQR